MTEPLFPHQDRAARRIAEGMPTYLGFDMGIGKTRTFIEAVKRRGAARTLVLCPASALLVWKREITRWHPGAAFRVATEPSHLAEGPTYILVSHGQLSRRGGPLAEALGKAPEFQLTALDEAHAFNAVDSLRVKALRRAAHNLGDIVPLSGTPMRNHAGDLYTLTAVCWPEGLRQPSGAIMSRYEFEEAFCRVEMKRFFNARPVRVITGSKNLAQLKTLLAPFMVRVRKEDVFKELPPILWDSVPVALDASLMSQADIDRLGALVHNLTVEELLAGRTGAAAGDLMMLRRMLGVAKLRGACEYIVDMLDNLPDDRKLLVYAVHADVISALHRHLAEYDPAVLTGKTTPQERELAVDKFLMSPQCRVFIGNIQAAGTALTLVGPHCKCSDVVFVESAWTPADNAQAACRVHRIGQRDGVVARMLAAAGTIDDLISDVLVRKAREFSQLFDTPSN